MSYPGNPALASDVQERISNTFQQTLGLVAQQRDQEALVGCEFILRMDADFRPAQTLVARIKSGERPVMIDDLKTSAPELPEAGNDNQAGTPQNDLDALDDLEDLAGLADFDELEAEDSSAGSAATPSQPGGPIAMPGPAPVESATSGLATMMGDLLAKRSFEQILQIAETQKQAVEADPQVQKIVETALGLHESKAYVEAFIKSAEQARSVGELEEMEKHLAKARALDPSHPDVQNFGETGTSGDSGDAEVLTFDEDEPPLDFDSEPLAGHGEDTGLLALQQQSLSLDADEMPSAAGAMAGLASDPRQTKPMAAVSGDSNVADAGGLDEGDQESVFFGEDDADDGAADFSFDTEGSHSAETLEDELVEDESLLEDPDPLDFGDGSGSPDGEGFGDEVGEAAAFDGVAGSGGPEDGDRVGELLAEGQESFDRGEYQSAIDVWSRIFLIDIDNAEASSRIEEARSKKAELERQAEELFHEAAGHIENEAIDEAKSALRKVLELKPNHSIAAEYLSQLESGQVPTLAPAADLDTALASVEGTAEFAEETDAAADSPSLDAAVQRDRIVVVKKTDKKIIVLGAAVLLAVVGLGSFLMLKWDDLFQNQPPPPTMAQAPQIDPLERATKMHESGNTENAIIQLERIQAQDPIYEKAQALIAQWKALVDEPQEAQESGPTPEQQRRLDLLLGAARDASQQGRYRKALDYFDRASKILPLSEGDQTLKLQGENELRPLESQIRRFADGDYASIIPELWRLRETAASKQSVDLLLVDSYYNLALTDLQRGNTAGAAGKMKEALEVQPDNVELERLRLFAETYSERRQDLLYRIFVKYLPSH